MKSFVDMNRITGKGKSLDICVVKDGYIRTYGGMVAIGHEKENGNVIEFAVAMETLKKIIQENNNGS
jgi:ribosomal protein L9